MQLNCDRRCEVCVVCGLRFADLRVVYEVASRHLDDSVYQHMVSLLYEGLSHHYEELPMEDSFCIAVDVALAVRC